MSKIPDQKEIETILEAAASEGCEESSNVRSCFQLDMAKYESLLGDTDIPQEHKREMINALWSIVVAFVEAGYGTHPVQQARGKGNEEELECSNTEGDSLYSSEPSDRQIEFEVRLENPESVME